jgi:sugar/nucleoside kinase (ribokinase family)
LKKAITLQKNIQKMMKILGFGNALVDILTILECETPLKELNLPKGSMQLLDESGLEKMKVFLSARNTQTATGGSAGNLAKALGKLQAHPGFLGSVGKDEFGELFENRCREDGVQPLLCHHDLPTGIATTLITPDGERTFGTYLGAAAVFYEQEIQEDILRAYDVLFIEGYWIQNPTLMEQMMATAHRLGLKVALDLASYNIVEENKDFFRRVMREYVDVVFANEKESEAFSAGSPEDAAREMAELCQIAVVKIGKEGAYVATDADIRLYPSIRVDHVIDTTGAGDFFAAGFLYGLTHEKSPETSARIGSILGSTVIQYVGTTLPESTWKEVNEQIAMLK